MFNLEDREQFIGQKYLFTFQMIQALARFHESGRLHLALTPAHFHFTNQAVTIQSASDTEILLQEARKYAAPELLKNLGRDERSDLYALGKILFEAWTGEMPPMAGSELPPFSHWFPELPKAFDDFFNQLLAEEPAHRFSNCSSALLALQAFEAFFHPQQQAPAFVGRKSELDWIRYGLQQSDVLLITGPAGMGKTTLISQALKGSEFLSGKFQQARTFALPYAVFMEAMKGFLKRILSLPGPERARWKLRLTQELGLAAPILYERLPELPLILEDSKRDQRNDSIILENPFNRAFFSLWEIVCAHQRTVFWLDDVQWADNSSQAFFQQLLVLPINWVISGRDTHTFKQAVSDIKRMDSLNLQALDFQSIHLYLQETLTADANSTQNLVPVLQRLTQGNPLYLKLILNEWQRNHRLQKLSGHWQLQPESEWHSLGFSEQTLQKMWTQQMAELSSEERRLLGLAACLGTHFSYLTLQTCYGGGTSFSHSQEVNLALQGCLERGYLLPLSQVHCRFAHDRLHEWVLQSFTAEEQQKIRLQAGKALLLAPISTEVENLIETLNPIYAALEPQELGILLEANLLYCEKILKQGAQREARQILSLIHNLITIFPLTQEQDFRLGMIHASLDYLDAHLDKAEVRLLDMMHKFAHLNLTEAQVLLVIIFTQQNRYAEAVQLTMETLGRMGLELSQSPEEIEMLFGRCIQTLSAVSLADLVAFSQRSAHPQFSDMLQFFAASTPALYNFQPQLFGLFVMYFLDQILHVQGAPQASIIYTAGAIVMSAQSQRELSLLLSDAALATANTWGHQDEICTYHCIVGDFVSPWREPYRVARQHFEASWKAGLQSGNLQFTGYSRVFKGANLFLSGYSLKAFQEQELPDMLAFNATTQNLSPLDGITGYALVLHALRDKACAFELPELTEIQYISQCQARGSQADMARYYSFKAFVLLLFDHHREALDNWRKSQIQTYLQGSVANVLNLFTGLILHLRTAEPLESFSSDWNFLQTQAQNCPENFAALASLVQAELAPQAEKLPLLHEALVQAREQGLHHLEALSLQWLGDYWQIEGKSALAHQNWFESSLVYEYWGAPEKAQDMRAKLPVSLRQRYESAPISPSANQDLALLMEISAIFAQSLREEDLISAMMDVLKKQTRAENMYLLIPGEDFGNSDLDWICLAQFHQHEKRSEQTFDLRMLPLNLMRYIAVSQRSVRLPRDFEAFSQIPEVGQLKGAHFFLPLVLQNQLKGLIYLSAEHQPEAFGLRTELLLKALAGHMASALANARRYRQLEETIRSRTQDLLAANQELQQLLDEKQQVLAIAAHDLKHPLGTLTLGVSMLERLNDQLTPEAREQAYYNLKKTLSEMNGNTERLLMAERLNLDAMEVRLQTVVPLEEIRQWLSSQEIHALEKQIQLHFLGFEGPVSLETDPTLLKIILENLLSNALKFSPPASVVTLRFLQESDAYLFEVQDTGPGIPVEEQPRLFQKFARLSPQPTAGETSSGLGLFIVQKLTEILQGTLYVDSATGKGSLFRVRFGRFSQNAHNSEAISG